MMNVSAILAVCALTMVGAVLACAGAAPDQIAPATPYPTYTPYPTHTPPPTLEPLPTYTPYPTNTPYPTHTVVPTATVPPAPTPTRTAIPTITRRPTATPIPTAHAEIRRVLECPDCKFVMPRLGTDNPDLKRFINWPAKTKHRDRFIVAACGMGQSLSDKGRTHVVSHSQLGSGRATASKIILINTTKAFPDKQCFAAIAKYDGFIPVEWQETTRLTSTGGIYNLPSTKYYDVDHVSFANPTKRMELSTGDFLSLFRKETP